jgi:hypothetical protein
MLVFKFVLEDEFGDKFFGNGALGYRVRMIDQWCGLLMRGVLCFFVAVPQSGAVQGGQQNAAATSR